MYCAFEKKKKYIYIYRPVSLKVNLWTMFSVYFCDAISVCKMALIELSYYITTELVNTAIFSPWSFRVLRC